MSRMRRLAFLLVAVLAATVFLTAVDASHTYGHRYIVMGRVLDADGTPFQAKTVTISTWLGETKQAEMAVVTDCNGDFYSPNGQPSPLGARYNYLETNNEGATNFHYHDSDLSRVIQVRFAARNDTWTESFNPDRRYTFSTYRMSESFDPAPGCPDTENFGLRFTVHVWMATRNELKTGEDVINARRINVTLTTGGQSLTNGTETDQNGNVWITFNNVTVSAGDTYVVSSEFLRRDRTVTISQDDVAYGTADSHFVVDVSESSGIDAGLRNFLILLAVVGVVVLAYLGFQKMKQRQELKRAYQSTERRRARRKS